MGWVTIGRQTQKRKHPYIDLSQERIRHLHTVCAPSPRPSDACVALRGVRLLVIRRHVRGVKHEDVDRVSEAARQRTRERREQRFDWDLQTTNCQIRISKKPNELSTN